MSRLPRPPFQAKLGSKPVREIDTKRGRITVGLIVPGMVTLLEEHATRKDAGYTLPEWRRLAPRERALEVALRRTMNQIQAIEQDLDEEERKNRPRRK